MKSARFQRAPRGLAAFALVSAAALALAGCAGSTGTAAPTTPTEGVDPHAPEVSAVNVAGYVGPGTAPLMAANLAGLPEEYGVTLELQPAETAPAMLAQLIGGDVPIAQVNGFFSVPALREGANILVIGELIRGVPGAQTVEVAPDSGIDSVADLEGKKVAVLGLNSGHQARIMTAMEAEGADAMSVEFVSLGWNEMAPALEQGTVDAVVVTGAGQLQARTVVGSKTILDLGDGDFKEFPDSQWLVNGDWAAENPNAVAAFQCSVVIGGAELVTSDQEAYEGALREFGLSEEAIANDTKLIFPAANEPAQVIPDMMFELGWIPEAFDLAAKTIPLPDNC